MTKKLNTERFVFSDGGYQDFPHETEKTCVIVPRLPVAKGWEYNELGVLHKVLADPKVLVAALRQSLGNYIDAEAQKLGYDNIISAVSYKDEPEDPVNQVYALALSTWRSACYKKARELEPTLTADHTWDDLRAELPVFVVPTIGGI